MATIGSLPSTVLTAPGPLLTHGAGPLTPGQSQPVMSRLLLAGNQDRAGPLHTLEEAARPAGRLPEPTMLMVSTVLSQCQSLHKNVSRRGQSLCNPAGSWPGLASQLLGPVVPVEWRGAGSSSGTTGTQERVQAPWRRLATGQQGISGGSGGREGGWVQEEGEVVIRGQGDKEYKGQWQAGRKRWPRTTLGKIVS